MTAPSVVAVVETLYFTRYKTTLDRVIDECADTVCRARIQWIGASAALAASWNDTIARREQILRATTRAGEQLTERDRALLHMDTLRASFRQTVARTKQAMERTIAEAEAKKAEALRRLEASKAAAEAAGVFVWDDPQHPPPPIPLVPVVAAIGDDERCYAIQVPVGIPDAPDSGPAAVVAERVPPRFSRKRRQLAEAASNNDNDDDNGPIHIQCAQS